MRDVFKPWYRKIGLVTLLLACAVAVYWVRSCQQADFISVPVSELKNVAFFSGGQSFCFLYGNNWYRKLQRQQRGPVVVYRVQLGPGFSEIRSQKVQWWSLNCTEASVARSWEFDGPLNRMIPYWVVVLPLTILSAWLLLSKRREERRELKKLDEPSTRVGESRS